MNSQLFENIIVLISKQRSGSNLFRKVLNSHNEIVDLNEILHPNLSYLKDDDYSFKFFIEEKIEKANFVWESDIFEKYLVFLHEKFSPKKILLDIKYNSFLKIPINWRSILDEPHLIDFFKKRKIKIIHLIRQNKLEQYCSTKISDLNKAWVTESKEQLGDLIREIYLDVDDLKKYVNQTKKEDLTFELFFQNYPDYLKFYYEDLTTPQESFNEDILEKVAALLNIENEFKKDLPTIKMGRPINKSITNYLAIRELYNDIDKRTYISMPETNKSEINISTFASGFQSTNLNKWCRTSSDLLHSRQELHLNESSELIVEWRNFSAKGTLSFSFIVSTYSINCPGFFLKIQLANECQEVVYCNSLCLKGLMKEKITIKANIDKASLKLTASLMESTDSADHGSFYISNFKLISL